MTGLSHIAQSERSDIEAVENELMDRQQDVADLSAEVDDLSAEVDDLFAEVARLRVERDEAVERTDIAEGALQREQDARLEMDNHIAQLLDAIREHRRLILERVPAKSGRKIDESLWWWIQ